MHLKVNPRLLNTGEVSNRTHLVEAFGFLSMCICRKNTSKHLNVEDLFKQTFHGPWIALEEGKPQAISPEVQHALGNLNRKLREVGGCFASCLLPSATTFASIP